MKLVVLLPLKAHNVFRHLIGTHKVQRVPNSEKNGRRHSSEVIVAGRLETKSIQRGIPKDHLKITFYRGSGNGGQKRNKTDSCVRIHHLPTGIISISEDSTSQGRNKQEALRRLEIKLAERQAQDAQEAENSQRREAFAGGADWTWVGWRDSVVASNGAKHSMTKAIKRGIPAKLLR